MDDTRRQSLSADPFSDISILSEEFLGEVRGMPQRNLAVEMLRKLLSGEIKARGRKNVVQARSFAGNSSSRKPSV